MKKTKTIKKEPIRKPTTTIKDCTFNGVVWDSQATEAVNTVAKALLNLSELFKSQNIKIESLISIKNDDHV